ncbi:MAG: tetraacyldisaccharide 4'-kinase [Hyphomicrobiaceae bacterium]
MPRKAPRFWSEPRPTACAQLLRPLAAIYGAVARSRLGRPGYRSRRAVVCIGNFTAGGAGKTPMAIWVGRELKRLGHTPVFLSRGYGGRIAGPHLVDPVRDRAADVGDEPLLLARTGSVVVARDRVAGARLIESLDADVIVMDDGLQNPSLVKDVSIGIVDAGIGFGNGLVIPAGPLRLPLAAQLPLVDAIVSIDSGDGRPGPSGLQAWPGPIHRARFVPAGDARWLRDRPVVAFAGIGRPDKFFATLRTLGAELRIAEGFPDHHCYTVAEAERLLLEAHRNAAALVTTEKDIVRLTPDGTCGTLKETARALAVTLELTEAARLSLLDLLRRLPRG